MNVELNLSPGWTRNQTYLIFFECCGWDHLHNTAAFLCFCHIMVTFGIFFHVISQSMQLFCHMKYTENISRCNPFAKFRTNPD